jgi:hypothetical protein
MKWKKILGIPLGAIPVWAALCTASADGSDPNRPLNSKHTILAMVQAPENEVESEVCALLISRGWREPTIKTLKKLVPNFHSDDEMMQACYVSAKNKVGGMVIYSDPIEDA